LGRPREDVTPEGVQAQASLREDVAALLHAEVAAMNLDNFVVRPKRRLVEQYAKPEVWTDFEKFKQIAQKLKDASAKAAGAAKQGKGNFTAAFNDMTKVCKECHETFREKID
jgi:cytochrome c556